jgi:hypothetical protein
MQFDCCVYQFLFQKKIFVRARAQKQSLANNKILEIVIGKKEVGISAMHLNTHERRVEISC